MWSRAPPHSQGSACNCPQPISVTVAQPESEAGVRASAASQAVWPVPSCRPFSLCPVPPCRGPEEDGEDEAAPGPRQAHDSLYRVHMPSLYSCGSTYGSEASIPAAAHTVSNAPVTEYM